MTLSEDDIRKIVEGNILLPPRVRALARHVLTELSSHTDDGTGGCAGCDYAPHPCRVRRTLLGICDTCNGVGWTFDGNPDDPIIDCPDCKGGARAS